VATEFFHIFYAPLFPIGSRVVFDQGAPKRILQGLQPPQDAPAPADTADTEHQTAESETEDELRIPIPMSGKSVLLGYLRGWGFWLTVFCGLLGGMLLLMSRSDEEAGAMFPGFLLTAGIGFVLAMASYYGPWNTASSARATHLCEEIGLDPATLPNEFRQTPSTT